MLVTGGVQHHCWQTDGGADMEHVIRFDTIHYQLVGEITKKNTKFFDTQ